MPSPRWQQGQSGNTAGRPRGSRNKLSEEVICALLRDFRKHGEKAIAKVRRDQPGVYLKVIALLIPREHEVEHRNRVKELSDEQHPLDLVLKKEGTVAGYSKWQLHDAIELRKS